MCATATGPSYTWPIVNDGLVTRSRTPSARDAPRTNVVFPVPRSPAISTMSPGPNARATASAARSVASAERLSSWARDMRAAYGPVDLEQAELVVAHRDQLRGRVGLRLGLGHRLFSGQGLLQELRQLGEVAAQALEHRRRVQRGRRMEDREQEQVAPADRAQLRDAADLGDPLRAAGEQFRREVPERADHP